MVGVIGEEDTHRLEGSCLVRCRARSAGLKDSMTSGLGRPVVREDEGSSSASTSLVVGSVDACRLCDGLSRDNVDCESRERAQTACVARRRSSII